MDPVDPAHRGASPTHVLLLTLLAACSVDVHGLAPVERVPTSDGGADGAFAMDGRSRDTGCVDTGSVSCESGVSRCEGEVLWSCLAGVPESTDCAATGAFCDTSTASPSCLRWVCTPSTTSCSPDATAVLTCDARGTDATASPCPAGCDPGAATCRAVPDCPGATDIGAGTRTFNLCDETADERPIAGGDCNGANGRDAVFRLVLGARRDVVLDLADDDDWVPIDTVLYVRTACGDAMSQIACSDDILCGVAMVSDGCYRDSDIQVRESRLQITLDPGTYFIVADYIDRWSGFTHYDCGDVRLQVSFP